MTPLQTRRRIKTLLRHARHARDKAAKAYRMTNETYGRHHPLTEAADQAITKAGFLVTDLFAALREADILLKDVSK